MPLASWCTTSGSCVAVRRFSGCSVLTRLAGFATVLVMTDTELATIRLQAHSEHPVAQADVLRLINTLAIRDTTIMRLRRALVECEICANNAESVATIARRALK